MTIRFKQPPLLELVAELRWDFMPDAQTTTSADGTFQVQIATGFDDSSFDAFREAVQRESGFTYTERLVPFGQPPVPGQPLLRLTRPSRDVIVQIGLGVLLIHALPPYNSWGSFSPEVAKIVDTLISTVPVSHGFNVASLRYLDAFGEKYLRGKSQAEFASDVLGYKISLPRAITLERDPAAPMRIATNVGFTTRGGLQAQISLSEGVINNEASLITDTSVSAVERLPSETTLVMEHFEEAHSVIHNIFMDSTSAIRPLMEPIDDDNA